MGDVRSALLACLKADKFVDLSIICRDKTIRAHRVVIAAQSDFFAKHDGAEIDMSEHNSDAVFAMIHWFYVKDYPERRGITATVLHIRVYNLAEALKIDDLADHAQQVFLEALQDLVDDSIQKPNEACAVFRNAINSTEPESYLRVTLLQVLGHAHRTVFDKDNKAFRNLRAMIFREFPHLSLDILACMTDSMGRDIMPLCKSLLPGFARLADHDYLGHELIDVATTCASSESGDCEITANKNPHTPLSATSSSDESDDSTGSWLCTKQVSKGLPLRRSSRPKEVTPDELPTVPKSSKAHKKCSCGEARPTPYTCVDILAGAGGARRGD